MSSGSNFETYSEDYSDGGEAPIKKKNSPKPLSSLEIYSSERKKANDCSCQTEVHQKGSYTPRNEFSRIPKHRSSFTKRENIKLRNIEYDIYDDMSSFSDETLSPKNRVRKLSEQPRKNRVDAIRQRARTFGPGMRNNKPKAGAKTTVQNATVQNNSTATRRLLSARKLKIDDLRNEVLDLKRQLTEELKENKILRSLYNRQQKELDKVEESRVEIPELEKAHDEEIRVLKTLMRKVQDRNKELEMKLKTKEDELQRRFNTILNLKASLNQKKKTEGETEKRMNALKMRVQKRDETISMLRENLSSTEKKLSDDRKNHETAKNDLKNLKKKYDELRRTSCELQMLKHNAMQAFTSTDAVDCKGNSPLKGDVCVSSPHHKQQDGFGRDKDSQVSSQRLRRMPTNSGEFSHSDKDKPNQKPLAAATRVALVSPSSDARPDSCESRNINKQPSGSEVSVRLGSRLKLAHSENMHVPLIFPTSAPIKSITESDSSCAGSQADEFSANNRKPTFKGNLSFIGVGQLNRDNSKQR